MGAVLAAGVLGLVSCDGVSGPSASEHEVSARRVPGAWLAPPPPEVSPPPGGPVEHAPQQLLVRFRSGTPTRAAERVHQALGGRVLRSYRVPSNLHLVELPAGVDVPAGMAQYRQDPSVRYVQPNYRYEIAEQIPDDPFFFHQWGLHNVGTNGYLDADIDAPEAWDITTGSPGTILGVLDTGIDYDHEDLVDNVFSNPGEVPGNGLDDDGNGYVDDVHGINAILHTGDPRDDNGHGTHVSGTIAARGNNAIGVAGVSWEARVVACKAFDSSGNATDADLLTCMQYFLDLKTRTANPVDIVATNNSWGGGGFSQALIDAITAHEQAGMLFVAAAGNYYGNDNDRYPFYPASYDPANIISVAATNWYDELAYFSNYGRRSVDVAAPGEEILSTVPGGYGVNSGTSMATPHVTGLIGLLRAIDPTLGPAALKNLIMTGGDENPSVLDRTLSGRRINAFSSLTCEDRALFQRLAPTSDEITIPVGDSVALEIVNIVCAAPSSAPQTVTVLETGEVITLTDESGSGSFAGSFTPLDFGTFTLAFSSGDAVIVHVVRNYDPPVIVDFEYRDIEGTRLPLYSGYELTSLETPFPIHFGNDERGFDVVYVGSNGVLSFTDQPYEYEIPLPASGYETIVAPLWTYLSAEDASSGVFYEVRGAAPRRELVIEWRSMSNYYYGNSDGVTFQVVFFENSPNILFSYEDVIFGTPWRDYGRDANVGVQVGHDIARQYSFFVDDLRNQTTLFWNMGAPIASAGPAQVVAPGADVTLDGSASRDLDGEIVFYVWTQLAGAPVLIRNASNAVASFTAPHASGTLTFELWVVDDEGNIDSDTVDVIVNQAPVASAGSDFMLATNLRGTLDGTASRDPDGAITGYEWRQVNGDPVEILDARTAIATFVAPATPQYLVFELIVTDEHGYQGSDFVVVEIFHNDAPVAVAGPDRMAPPGSTITLDGSASHDPDGSIVAYAWQVTACMTLDGPCVIDLAGADTATPTFTLPGSTGFVHLALTVTDDAGATASDTTTVVVFQQ